MVGTEWIKAFWFLCLVYKNNGAIIFQEPVIGFIIAVAVAEKKEIPFKMRKDGVLLLSFWSIKKRYRHTWECD